MSKSKSPQPPAPPATNIQIVCQEPINVPRDAEPAEQSPPLAENAPRSRLILVVVATIFLVFFPWLDPAQTQALWHSLIQQIFQLVKLP